MHFYKLRNFRAHKEAGLNVGILEQGRNNVKKLSMGILRMVEEGSHKEVIMGSYADCQN